MANKNQVVGAMPFGPLLRAQEYIAAGIIYPGDFVTQESAGRVAAATATTALCGVALNYASAAGQKVLIADDPQQRFICQADDSTVDAQTDIGLNYDIVAGSGNTTYKTSGHQVDASTQATTSTLPLKLLEILPAIDNALGDKVKCKIIINNHQQKGGTGTAGV